MDIRRFLKPTRLKILFYIIFASFEILIQFLDLTRTDLITRLIVIFDTAISIPVYFGLEISNAIVLQLYLPLFILLNVIYFYILACLISAGIDRIVEKEARRAAR